MPVDRLFLLALLLGCNGSGDAPDGGPDGITDDTGVAVDTDDTDDTEDPVETVPGVADAVVRFEPDGGGFIAETDLTLSSSTGEGEVWFCLAPPDETDCTFRLYEEPVELDDSIVVHAQVRVDDAAGETRARSYFQLDDDLETWSSNLPVLVFWTDDNLPDDTSDRVPFGLDLLEPGDDDRTSLLSTPTNSGRARLRIRGSSSSSFSKKSYDLELWEPDSEADREVELLGMSEDADWVLYGPYYYDDVLFRNRLAFQTSNEVGRWAPDGRSVEVFIAERGRSIRPDNYVGVYTVIEEIERGAHRVDVTGLDPEDIEEPEVTGGYVFKRDRPDDDDRSLDCGTAGGEIYYQYGLQMVDPEEHELADEQFDYLFDECDAVGWALVSEDFTDPDSGRHYSDIIDVDSFIDHHILNVIFKNPDAFRLSGYMFKDREGLIEAGPLWDFDRSADSADERAYYPTWWDAKNQTSDTTYVFESSWYEWLMEDPAFADAYWTRWEELLAGPLSAEAMDARIVALAEELEEAGDRDKAAWGGTDFGAEVAKLRTWMEVRNAWISDCIATLEDPRTCRGE